MVTWHLDNRKCLSSFPISTSKSPRLQKKGDCKTQRGDALGEFLLYSPNKFLLIISGHKLRTAPHVKT